MISSFREKISEHKSRILLYSSIILFFLFVVETVKYENNNTSLTLGTIYFLVFLCTIVYYVVLKLKILFSSKRDKAYRNFLEILKYLGNNKVYNFKSYKSGDTTLDRYNQLKSNKEKFYLFYAAMETIEHKYFEFEYMQDKWKRSNLKEIVERNQHNRFSESYKDIFVQYSDWYNEQESPSLDTFKKFLDEKVRVDESIRQDEKLIEDLCLVNGVSERLAETIAKKYSYNRSKIKNLSIEELTKINGIGTAIARDIKTIS